VRWIGPNEGVVPRYVGHSSGKWIILKERRLVREGEVVSRNVRSHAGEETRNAVVNKQHGVF